MSGLGAPARTATPYPERARVVFESAATLPLAINPSRAAGGAAITSKASPPLIRPTNSELSPILVFNLYPEYFSNSGPISWSTVQMARDVKTFSSADDAVPCDTYTNRHAINESTARWRIGLGSASRDVQFRAVKRLNLVFQTEFGKRLRSSNE